MSAPTGLSPLPPPLQVIRAFQVMDLVPEQIMDVLSILSGVLHLGNVSFVSAAGAQIADKSGEPREGGRGLWWYAARQRLVYIAFYTCMCTSECVYCCSPHGSPGSDGHSAGTGQLPTGRCPHTEVHGAPR